MVLILDVYSKKNLCSSENSHKSSPHTAQAYYSSDLSQGVKPYCIITVSSLVKVPPTHYAIFFLN